MSQALQKWLILNESFGENSHWFIGNFRSEESDGDAPGEEPEKEKKKRKLVYREPRNKLTGVKQVKKTRKTPKPAPKLENLETRKSSRQTTIDQRQDGDEYKPEKETRKRPVKKQRQMTQGSSILDGWNWNIIKSHKTGISIAPFSTIWKW